MEILQDRENVINSMQTFLRKFNRYFFFETPKVLLLAWDRVSEIKDAFGNKQYIHEELAEYINTSRDEHLSTILKIESDEVIKSSVKDLVPIPNDSTSIDDDSFSIEDINYVEASPPDSEPVSLEEVKDEILRVKLLNVNLLIAKIESLNDNLTPDRVLKSPSLFPILVEDSDSFFEKSILLSLIRIILNPNSRLLAIIRKRRVVAVPLLMLITLFPNTYQEPQVHVPNVLPTHLTLMLDSDFIPLDDSLGSDLKVSFPSRARNKIFDPVIFFEVQSKKFLSRDTFYISFICDPLCPVSETLLPFSYENEDQVFNPGILSSNLLSHRGKITSDFSENPMIISGGDIPFLDVPFLHFYLP
nr:hypothetical protein [Tanacetum cinerariifolium]